MLGHELRNPLAPIRNAVHLLGSLEYGDPLFVKCRAMIEKQSRHITRLVDDLLDVSRITQGKIQLRLESVDLAAAVRHAASATEHERARTGQSLEMGVPEGPMWVRADAARLDQILANLLGNAAKFTPDGGHIWVRVERESARDGGRPASAVLRVRDDGLGIELQDLAVAERPVRSPDADILAQRDPRDRPDDE